MPPTLQSRSAERKRAVVGRPFTRLASRPSSITLPRRKGLTLRIRRLAIGLDQHCNAGIVPAVERRQSLSMLGSRGADQRVGKLQSMASTISAKAIASQLTGNCVDGHAVQTSKESRDCFLLSGTQPGTNF